MPRRSKGRQRVEMVKMNNESNLQVTFSKRRSGLFKKASELCTLCGAEIAIIVFSPGRKVFSFGHPCVETVVNRFLNGNPAPPPAQQNSGTMQLIEAHRNATVRDLNMQLTQVNSQLEMEKARGEELGHIRKANQGGNWWESPMEEMSPGQLDQLKAALEELKKNVTEQAQRLLVMQTSQPQHFYMGSSSNGGGLPFDQNTAAATPPLFNPNMMHPYGYNNSGFNYGFY